MTAKIIPFTGISKVDLDPDLVLEGNKGEFEGVVLLGFGKDGDTRFCSTYADGGTILWLLEQCKLRLLQINDDY